MISYRIPPPRAVTVKEGAMNRRRVAMAAAFAVAALVLILAGRGPLAEDDKADPALAGQASRRLVEEEGVVALVGSASLLECSVNAQYYGEQNILSIQGTGVDPVCFLAPNISPVNTGPYLGITVGLYFASEALKDEKICAIMLRVAGLDEAVKAAVDRWSQITGKEITFFDISLHPTDDPT